MRSLICPVLFSQFLPVVSVPLTASVFALCQGLIDASFLLFFLSSSVLNPHLHMLCFWFKNKEVRGTTLDFFSNQFIKSYLK